MSPNDRTPTPLEVCRELVEDVEALGGMEYVDREWPDMAVTYEHALAAIAKAKYEERRAAPAQDVRDAAITPFREACMRAWVDGWNTGRDRAQTDDGKRAFAEKLAKGFPTENAAQEMLLACKCALADLEGLTGDYVDYDSDEPVAKTVRELRAVIAKAEGENP